MSGEWIPRGPTGDSPAYLGIVEALAADLSTGTVVPGTKLLPQRELAERLGLSVGTVAKAYSEAARRGLVAGEVGRGTFVSGGRIAVRPPAEEMARVDMSLNVPPETGAGSLIARAMEEVAQSGEVAHLLDYLPHAGVLEHRTAMAGWLETYLGPDLSADRVVLCNGAQHGIALALMASLQPGDAVLAETFTYPGIIGIADRLGHRLHGVRVDAEGLVPEALDAAFANTGARALYCMPTLQTPSGAIMSHQRRIEIVDILRQHDAWAIEDDVYGFLAPDAQLPLARLAPERVCYVNTLAKCLAPGLRVGALVIPTSLRNSISGALRATGWMASPLLTATAANMLRSGAVADQAIRKRTVAAERWELARKLLGSRAAIPANPAFHMWLPFDGSPAKVVADAASRGIMLSVPVAAFGAPAVGGLRLCLGAPATLEDLRRGLGVVIDIVYHGGGRALV